MYWLIHQLCKVSLLLRNRYIKRQKKCWIILNLTSGSREDKCWLFLPNCFSLDYILQRSPGSLGNISRNSYFWVIETQSIGRHSQFSLAQDVLFTMTYITRMQLSRQFSSLHPIEFKVYYIYCTLHVKAEVIYMNSVLVENNSIEFYIFSWDSGVPNKKYHTTYNMLIRIFKW